MEYMEEYPPLLSLVGMASKIKNYFKRKPGTDSNEEAEKFRYNVPQCGIFEKLLFLVTFSGMDNSQWPIPRHFWAKWNPVKPYKPLKATCTGPQFTSTKCPKPIFWLFEPEMSTAFVKLTEISLSDKSAQFTKFRDPIRKRLIISREISFKYLFIVSSGVPRTIHGESKWTWSKRPSRHIPNQVYVNVWNLVPSFIVRVTILIGE